VFCSARIVDNSAASAQHDFTPTVAWNDGTAQSAVALANGGVAVTAFNLLGTNGTPYNAGQVIYAAASSTITLGATETVDGTGDGTTDIEFSVYRLA